MSVLLRMSTFATVMVLNIKAPASLRQAQSKLSGSPWGQPFFKGSAPNRLAAMSRLRSSSLCTSKEIARESQQQYDKLQELLVEMSHTEGAEQAQIESPAQLVYKIDNESELCALQSSMVSEKLQSKLNNLGSEGDDTMAVLQCSEEGHSAAALNTRRDTHRQRL